VGGGIRDVDTALEWLDAGASQVMLGTAATPEVLSALPRERVIAALDAVDGEIVIDGWRTRTGRNVIEAMHQLRSHVGGFLLTLVEREGRMKGTDLPRAAYLRKAAADLPLTLAGGITTPKEVAALDRLGIDAQVGMALYKNELHLADALAAPLQSDRPDGLWPTVVTDELGCALGLAWSSPASLRAALDEGAGVYESRARGLWRKGAESGNTQTLIRVDLDCDRDALRFTVRQRGPGFCHQETPSCWGNAGGLSDLERRIVQRARAAPPDSYTARLLTDPELLRAKLTEEAGELASAEQPDEIVAEAADLLYFTLVRLTAAGASLADVERELDRRALRVRRRGGDRKPT
jgi:phosphoribosyl-ATP pyrophosphohydrolase